MSATRCQDDATSSGGVQNLIQTLTGAFAENVDLGARGPQIRALGQSLETMIEALRWELAALGAWAEIDGWPLDLGPLSRMAQIARAYGICEDGELSNMARAGSTASIAT